MTRIAQSVSGTCATLNGTALAAGLYHVHAGASFRVLASAGLLVCGTVLLALAVTPRRSR